MPGNSANCLQGVRYKESLSLLMCLQSLLSTNFSQPDKFPQFLTVTSTIIHFFALWQQLQVPVDSQRPSPRVCSHSKCWASPSSGSGNPSGRLSTDSPRLTFLCTREFVQFCSPNETTGALGMPHIYREKTLCNPDTVRTPYFCGEYMSKCR